MATVTCRAMRTKGALPLLAPVDRMTKEVSTRVNTRLLRGAGNKGKVLLSNMPNIGEKGIAIVNNNITKAGTTGVTVNLNTSMAVVSLDPSHLHRVSSVFNDRVRALVSGPFGVTGTITSSSLIVKTMLVPNSGTPGLIARRVVGSVRMKSMIISITISRKNVVRATSEIAARSGPACVGRNIVRCTITGVPKTIPRASAVTLAGIAIPCTLRVTGGNMGGTLVRGPTLTTKLGAVGNRIACGTMTGSLNCRCIRPVGVLTGRRIGG